MTDSSAASHGEEMHALGRELFPICRSLTGDGVRQTLAILKKHIPLVVHEVPSGTEALDWTVPKEWNIRDAYIADESGERIVDFRRSNLHVVGYSTPVDATMTLAELEPHLHSLEDQPNAIPYVTSYYKERWGFCLRHDQRKALKPGNYRVVIDSTLAAGNLTYADMILPGETDQEILVSTYVCHPSMANNELSGPLVATFLAKWLLGRPRRYTYRFVFVPETIGAIVYLSRHAEALKKNVVVGFNLSCIGDDRGYSFVASRYGSTLADRIATSVLSNTDAGYTRHSFLDRGSDERQYGAPGVDLPLVTLCRTKFARYPEYHTSLDDLTVVTPRGLDGGLTFVQRCVELAERNRTWKMTTLGEPQLGKRNLYPDLGTNKTPVDIKAMLDLIAYADGRLDLIALAEMIGQAPWRLYPIVEDLSKAGLLADVTGPP